MDIEEGRKISPRELQAMIGSRVVLHKRDSPPGVVVYVGQYRPLFGVDPNIKGIRAFYTLSNVQLGLFQMTDDTLKDDSMSHVDVYECLEGQRDGDKLQVGSVPGDSRAGDSGDTGGAHVKPDRKGAPSDGDRPTVRALPRSVKRATRRKR